MSKFTLIVFVFLFTIRVLNGAPFITTNQTTTNIIKTPNTETYDASHCPDNCTFIFSEDSVITAQKTLEKFLHKRKSMLIYVTLYQKNLTLLPADRKKQNQIREWQWTLTENLWYVDLPIDLDYASFHITYYGESRIRLDIEAVDSNCCTIGDDAVNKVRDRLWFDVFSNKSGSLLCNRYFDNQDWKTSFFAVTTVWIGYDLLCVAPDVDKNYSEKSDTTATILIPLFCFFIALYYPLLNKIIENANIRNHLEHVKSESGMKLTDYKKDDSPFGYRRIMLKYFFQTNKSLQCSNFINVKFIPLLRLTILYFFVYLFMTIVPMVLEYKFDEEELTDFDTIYKLGLPVFHFGDKTQINFTYQMCLTCLVYLPLTVAAKAYATYCFSEHSDFLIFINVCDCTGKNVDDIIMEMKKADNKDNRQVRQNDIPEDVQHKSDKSNTETSEFTNPHNNETSNVKTDQPAVQHNNDEPNAKTGKSTNQEADKQTFISDVLKFKFYSKFIMRFNLLLSKTFWQYILGKSGGESSRWHFVRFLIFIINVFLIVPMCAFPTIWFMLFPVFNRIRGWVPSNKTKLGDSEPKTFKKSKETESGKTKERVPEGTKETKLWNTRKNDKQKPEQGKLTAFMHGVLFSSEQGKLRAFMHGVLFSLEFFCIFLLYLDMSMIIFVERSVMYIAFIAITNYDHLLRIVIVVFTCAGYLGLFITAFVEKYAAVLKIMFKQLESTKTKDASKDSDEVPTAYPNETEIVKSKDASAATKDSQRKGFISEKHFDYVIDHSYAVREHFFFVILKIVTTVMFFIVSLAILLQSNVFDSTTKLTNIIEFMVIIVTPSLVMKCFEKDKDSPMKDHEQDIKDNTMSYEDNDSDSNNEINTKIDDQQTPQEPAVDNRILNSNKTRRNHEDTPLHNDNTDKSYKSTITEDGCNVQVNGDDGEKLIDFDYE